MLNPPEAELVGDKDAEVELDVEVRVVEDFEVGVASAKSQPLNWIPATVVALEMVVLVLNQFCEGSRIAYVII